MYMLHILYDKCMPLMGSLFPLFSPPILLPNKMLSLNHLSAFLDKRRYYETYVRYVTFLGMFRAVCVRHHKGGLFIWIMFYGASKWLTASLLGLQNSGNVPTIPRFSRNPDYGNPPIFGKITGNFATLIHAKLVVAIHPISLSLHHQPSVE
jgi:hypothetical protein